MKPNPSLLCMFYFYTDPRVSENEIRNIKSANEQKIITSPKLWKCEAELRKQAGVLPSALCMYCHSRQTKDHEGHFFSSSFLSDSSQCLTGYCSSRGEGIIYVSVQSGLSQHQSHN